jgi:hypothetical protein
MSDPNKKRIPADLAHMAERLRGERPEASALELDRIKLQAKARVSRAGSRRGFMGLRPVRSRLLSMVLVSGLLASGAGGLAATGVAQTLTQTVISSTDSGSTDVSASDIEYRCKPKQPKGSPPGEPPRRCIRP